MTSVSSEHYDYDIKIKKTVLNLNNPRAGDESGRGLGEGEKGRGIGREAKGRLQKEPSTFIPLCGRWRPQVPDWLSCNE